MKKKKFGIDTIQVGKKTETKAEQGSDGKEMFSYRLRPSAKKQLKIIAAMHDTSVQKLLDRGVELVLAEYGDSVPDEFKEFKNS